MTDVFISYAREDRARVRPLVEALQAEGWDVWWDPTEPINAGGDAGDAADARLASSGAVVVVWSAYSRGSEHVRAEAATGLYKNKLVQTRIDNAAPPRPFDQVEMLDLTAWSGERDDPNWRRIVSAVRLYAGLPGSVRPVVTRKASSPPAYIERGRTIAAGPLIGVAVLAVLGAGVWFVDPFGMRGGKAEPTHATEAGEARQAELTPEALAMLAASPEAEAAWAETDRDDPSALRAFLALYPQSNGAESARSLLRVLDAQAWVTAVTADTEEEYSAYLANFPADAAMPGAMTESAIGRLESLGNERSQAVGDIQRGLLALKLYSGPVDGEASEALSRALRTYASKKKRQAPSLAEAAPRDLRAFADVVSAEASGGAAAATKAETTAKATLDAAKAADARRVLEAEAARKQATAGAETLAASALDRTADDAAWRQAQASGTTAAYQLYLGSRPTGLHTADARAALARLNRPAAYSVQMVATDLRPALEAARRAQATATARAASARDVARRADDAAAQARSGAGVARVITAPDGDRYESEMAEGSPNGVGVRTSGDAPSRGDKYRGELRNGLGSGLGVYEFADNPNNAQAGALRYEGDHAGDLAAGYGVTTWKNGNSFAGQASSGVLIFTNGQRYEGQLVNGAQQGLGVLWSSDGQPVMAGRWDKGVLVEPMAPPAP